MLNEKAKYENLKEKNINKFGNKPKIKACINFYQSYNKIILKFKFNTILNLYLVFFLAILIRTILSNEFNFKKRELDNEDFCISLRINELGLQSIINSSYQDKIKVVIEGMEKNLIDNKIDVEEKANLINLKCLEIFTNCDYMFQNLRNIIEINLSNFDISQVTGMKNMFNNCSNLKQIITPNNFKASSLSSIHHMFYNCTSLKYIDLSNFETTDRLENMDLMFFNCKNLNSLDLAKINTQNVSRMESLFEGCSSLVSLNIDSWNTGNVTTLKGAFKGCSSLISLDLNHFDTSKVKYMDSMFDTCSSLEILKIDNFNTISVSTMASMFVRCSNLKSLNVSNFNTKSVTSMKSMFFNCKSLTSLDVSNFDTSNVKTMEKMFDSCISLSSLDISNFNTKKTTVLKTMFRGCSSLTYLNFSNFDTSSVSVLQLMLSDCYSLISLDLSNFNTSSVTNLEKMFYNCHSLISLNISNFNTSKVSKMAQMFSNCSSLETLDISNYDTSSVLNMLQMFYYCTSLTSLNLSNFDTSKVINMESMFEGCINLEYLNFKNFENNSNLNDNNMFLYTPEDLVYCIRNESNIPSELISKECTLNDCKENWLENKENLFENKKNNISSINDKCVLVKVKEISEDFFFSNKISNTSIYSYKLDSSINELKSKYTNLTFIDFTSDKINYIYEIFNLDKEKTNIYVLIADVPSSNSRKATSDFEYSLILENGTELNLSKINENYYVDISFPIRDLELAKFDFAKTFNEQGYDIYDKNSDFYNNFCSPASLGKNDIVLKDRKTDIYPSNVTLCKANCKYKSVNIEDKRIVCECNLNENNNNEEDNDDFMNEEDDGNFITYFVDKVNYKLFKCYRLLNNFNNYLNNLAFYVILGCFAIILSLCFIFLFWGISYIRIEMYKNIPSEPKVREMIIEELKKRREKAKVNNPTKKSKRKSVENIYKVKNDSNNKIFISSSESFNNINNAKQKYLKVFEDETKKKRKNSKNKKKTRRLSVLLPEINGIKITNSFPEKETKETIEDYNELPFTRALRLDKRNIFQILKSVLYDKLELVHVFISSKRIRIICLCEYILSLLFDCFFNALLYSDDVVSQKYHNNGELDFIVSLLITLISNIITSIVCRFINYSDGIEERLKEISDIRREYIYLFALNKFLKFLKIKMVLFIITIFILVSGCFYYIVIFCIIYSKSQVSLLTNYLLSLVEGLITSVIITILIVLTRKIGMSCSNNYIYNTSKFLNENF